MTNPKCPTCGGWGFINKITHETRIGSSVFEPKEMQLCDDIYPDDDTIPPHLRGQLCTPRTVHWRPEPMNTRRYGFRDSTPIALSTDKRREARAASQLKRGGSKR